MKNILTKMQFTQTFLCTILFVFPGINLAVFHINVSHEDLVIPDVREEIKTEDFSIAKRNIGSSTDGQQCTTVPVANRFDCYPDSSATEEKCLERGCCWAPHLPTLTQTVTRMNVPFCFFPTDYRSHEVTNVTFSDQGISVWYDRILDSGYPEDSNTIRMDIGCIDDKRLSIKIWDEEKQSPDKEMATLLPLETCDVSIKLSETNFGFQLVRDDTNTVLFEFF